MPTTTIVVLAVVGLFVVLGYLKGLLATLLDVLALGFTLVAIVLFTRPLGAWLSTHGPLEGFLGYALAPLVLVLGINIAFAIVRAIVRPRRSKDDDRPPRFRLAGAALNALPGLFYALVIVWAMMLYRGVATVDPPAERTYVEKTSGEMVSGLSTVLITRNLPEDRLLPVVAQHVLSDPAVGIHDLQTVVQSPRMSSLLQDPEFQAILNRGRVEEVMADRRFQALFTDPDLSGSFRSMGFLATDETERQFREHLAQTLITTWLRLNALANDPEVEELLSDPELSRALQEKDIAALLQSPEMARLVRKVFASPQP